MFTFQPIDLLIVLVAGLILIAGLSLLSLRRRDEILQDFLTPDESGIESEFLKRKEPVVKQQVEETKESNETDVDMEPMAWGTISEPLPEQSSSPPSTASTSKPPGPPGPPPTPETPDS